MKTFYSRILGRFLFPALLLGLNGCMTQGAIKYAEGHPEDANIFSGGKIKNTPVAGAQEAPVAEHPAKPNPAYYVLLPLTIPADIATSPLQGVCFLIVWTSN